MRTVLSTLEKLDGKFPGLLDKVKGWLGQGVTAGEMPQLLHAEYGVTVDVGVFNYFRAHRWAIERQRIALRKEVTQAAIEAIGGDAGFDSLLLAKLWEMMDKMTIPQMLTARSLFLKIRAQNLKEQEFLFKTGQLKIAPPVLSPEEREAQSRNALQRIKEIFGLAGDEPPKPRMVPLPAAAGNESTQQIMKRDL
jgi:hypothetical protein